MAEKDTILELIYKAKLRPGIYICDIHSFIISLERTSKEHNFVVFHLEGKDAIKKEVYIRKFCKIMNCPGNWDDPNYPDETWDGFEEYMRDLEWIPAKGYIIVYDNIEALAYGDSEAFATALDIFKTAISSWDRQGVPMYVLLEGEQNIINGLPFHKLSLAALTLEGRV